jgi:hypothetical protein
VSQCTSCAAPILWSLTVNDKFMPVDAEPSDDGNVEFVDKGRIRRAIVHTQPLLAPTPLHRSRFVTCPNADEPGGEAG